MEAGGRHQDRRAGNIDRRVDKAEWRLDALDEWRNGTPGMPGVDARVAILESEVQSEKQARLLAGVMQEKKIADAVAERLSAERGHAPVATEWPLWQKLGAFAGAFIVVADSVRGLIH